MVGLLSAIVGNGHIKYSLQRSHSTINLFRSYLLISHTFQRHGSVSDSKKSYLSMLNRMNFGNSYTDLILYCCCWGFALYYESSDLYLPYGTSLSEQSSSTTCLRELKFKPSLFKKGVNKHFSSPGLTLTLSISMWHFSNSWCVTQSWRILVFVQENWFHSFCGVAEDIPLLFCFPVPAALSMTPKVLITPTELNNLIFAATLERENKSAA